MPEYLFGIKVKAEELGEAVVGEPVEDETYWPDGSHSVQQTTKGLFIYSKEANEVGFLPFVEPA